MIMITGGAYQGKREAALKLFGISTMINGAECFPEEAFSCGCIYNYHLLVKRLLEKSIDPLSFTERLCAENPEVTVIIDEIGCGIIPIEKSERVWREQVGRCGCRIAELSEKVVRVICGVQVFIKGEAK